jgi:hypothetical protein
MRDDPQRRTSVEGDGRFRATVIGGAVVVSVILLVARFATDVELPALPPKPAGALERASAVTEGIRRSDRAYVERVRRDARRFGVATVPEEMERAFAYTREEPALTMDPRGTAEAPAALEAAGLRLRLEVESVPGTHREQMVLAIDNLLHKPVAYRVVTRPTAGTTTCRHKRALPHDAIALSPGGSIRRSECTYERGWGLEIRSVETIALPELGYVYVSQLRPRDLGLSERTSAAHRPAVGAPCDLIVSARVTRAIETGELSWRDSVDFYARHDCRQFTISPDYRAFERDLEHRLPAVSAGR